jgi:signal peptidase I
MTFPTPGPSEDDNQHTSGIPSHIRRWEPEPDAESTPHVEGSEPSIDRNGSTHLSSSNGNEYPPPSGFPDSHESTSSAERSSDLTSNDWNPGDQAWGEEPWTPAPAPEPRVANLGGNVFLILSGLAFVALALIIITGEALAISSGAGPIRVYLPYGMIFLGLSQVLTGIVNAYRGIESSDDPKREWKRVGRATIELTQTLVLAVLIFLAVRSMAQNFRVEGASMEPGLHNGQYLLVNKAVYFKLNLDTLDKFLPFIDPGDNPERFIFHGPQRGDVIVFEFPEDRSRDFIKRVIGVPGDTVKVENGVVSVNGKALEEDYVNHETRSNMDEKVVPPNEYFVLGDNRGNSSDSRSWGFVPEENIIGRAMFTYWPKLSGVGNRSIDLGIIQFHLP